ncbi:immunoglobulin-like and fibronectin type III domain-containing protein 1 isoform X2 [Esox lucius]|uniref:immunoglobulin-like and fibronectin type III domain-containing protein 1 isoform X2 n=1 Tax=Esox lucius TaxID=8010 RepID=UPI001476DBE1|nr:immunoglobulin-like and fibronectin type III domain-containing protein 1 isoform X2 [Esox lucius]
MTTLAATTPPPVAIKRRSRVPGVMITQFVEEIPQGKSTPDFTRKPFALTVQEGKLAFFKCMVSGVPTPQITWARSQGPLEDPVKYVSRYDKIMEEYIIEIPNVTAEQADTYKCFATNEFGKAVCTAKLNVIEVGFKKKTGLNKAAPEDYRKMLKKNVVRTKPQLKKEEGKIDPKFWEVLLSSPRMDYEKVCMEYGVKDFRWMLKQLNLKKKEREEEQAKVVEKLENLKQIEVKTDGSAEFELDMVLKDPESQVLLYKDGINVAYSDNGSGKHNLKKIGQKYTFSINDLIPDDAGLYQVDVEDATCFSTDFKIIPVEFIVKIQDVKVKEREDAIFECVLSQAFPKILWTGNNVPLEQGDKFDIKISEDHLIHRLKVKNCEQVDSGVYTAMASIASCSACLVVEAKDYQNTLGKKDRKSTMVGGGGLATIAADWATINAEKSGNQQDEHDLSATKCAQAEKDISGGEVPTAGVTAAVTGARKGVGNSSLHPILEGKEHIQRTQTLSEDAESCTEFMRHKKKNNINSGLSDIFATRGKQAELVCNISHEVDGAWFKDGKKLFSMDGLTIVKDGTSHKLIIHNCRDDDTGGYHFEAEGFKSEAKITVGDIANFDADNLHKFSKPVTVKAGQNASWKMSYTPQDNLKVKWFKEGKELMDGGGVKLVKEANHSRLLLRECLRSDVGQIKIQLTNPYGTIEATSRLIVLDKPGPPEGPVKILETTSTLIELQWGAPMDDGGSPVTNYIIERQQVGQTIWKEIGNVTADKTTYKDMNVVHGKLYIYKIYAVNPEGTSDALQTKKTMAGVMIFANPPGAPKVVDVSNKCINLKWDPPKDDGGITIIGYQLEKRKKDTTRWIALNPVTEPIKVLEYAVKDVVEGAEYEFRISAICISGAGEFSPPSVMVCVKNPNKKPFFKVPVDYMLIRAGNSVRMKVLYEAEPPPVITWLKDDEPISSFIQIINTEGCSQLVIPSSKRTDSGIYTIVAKNKIGEASFNIEVLVTDEPNAPGEVALEQIVHGKVIVSWEASPDQKLDNRLHYMVAEHNSETRIWHTVADRIFSNSFTAHNILTGREYHYKIYAKNDMGISDPSVSPTWGANSNKISVYTNAPVAVSFERPPSVLVPLKVHSTPTGYQLYMTCAIRGCPAPTVTWHLNDVCINGDSNYYITNSYGVCSIYILRVQPKDAGEYKVVAVNSFGKAECSTRLVVKD